MDWLAALADALAVLLDLEGCLRPVVGVLLAVGRFVRVSERVRFMGLKVSSILRYVEAYDRVDRSSASCAGRGSDEGMYGSE